ncbi:MAG: hypothetical protein JW809_08110 [Pirellulales bacterium]|nr:hypothetical protein [Pirellulales bacterium]
MKTLSTTNRTTHVARTLAPEDLRPGDFVGILSETTELPSFLWQGELPAVAADEPVRVRWLGQDGGTPLKVKAICLPFVFVRAPRGGHRTLDVRQHQLVRLKRRYARGVWKAMRRRKKRG